MSRTLTIPDHLYSRLAAKARSEGLGSVEEWLQNLAATLPGRAWIQISSPLDSTEKRPGMIGHALDEFIGDWSAAEEQEFLSEVAVFEQIDESLWK